jgi:hypothetical protein
MACTLKSTSAMRRLGEMAAARNNPRELGEKSEAFVIVQE